MAMKAWYLVAYDIRDDKRLRRVAKVLEGFGARMQYSVFRCRLSERDVERLRWELSKVLGDEDDVLYLGLCERCVERIRMRDSRGNWPDDPPDWVVL